MSTAKTPIDYVVYRVFHIETQKGYIGKCIRGLDRVHSHFKKFNNPKYEYRAKLLYRAMKCHGSDKFSFEILERVSSVKELNLAEKRLIETFDSRNPEKGYNIRPGGDGGDTYSYLTEEEKIVRGKNLSAAQKLSYKNDPDRKLALSKQMKKMRADPEKRRLNSQVCSERMKRLNKDPNFKRGKSIKGRRNKSGPLIMCHELNIIFEGLRNAAEYLLKDINKSSGISANCRGAQQSAHGYTWSYVRE